MLARVLSALVLIPALLAAVIFFPPWAFLLLLAAIGSVCLYEYRGLVEAMGLGFQPLPGYAALSFLLLGFHLHWLTPAHLVAAVVLASFLAALARKGDLRERATSVMATLLGIFYLAFCLYPAIPVRYEFGPEGFQWLMLTFIVTWSGDTAALFTGRKWGKKPLAPAISPKKTCAGAVAGLAAGLVVALLFQRFLWSGLPPGHVVAIAILVGVFGQLGDLAESLLKRAAGVKDSSHLIPGHGGVLDRIDSLLFSFPVLYLYLSLMRGAR